LIHCLSGQNGGWLLDLSASDDLIEATGRGFGPNNEVRQNIGLVTVTTR